MSCSFRQDKLVLNKMGCVESKEDETNTEPVKYSWDREDRPDPKDFTIANKSDETCGRKPGTINGQQFIIENCKNCVIYILDHSAVVTVDSCENCKLIIGPVKGSVFLRDCKNCQCIIACQQFRSRDCRKIDTYLFCSTQPIIESSGNMKFGCFQLFYEKLENHFQQAGFSIYNNSWSSIHDFTPLPDGNNWSLIASASIESHIPKPSTEEFQDIDISFDPCRSIVPLTRGKLYHQYDQSCLIVFFPGRKIQCKEFWLKLKDKETEFDLIQTKEIKMTVDDAKRVFKNDKYTEHINQGEVIGIELNGKDIIKSSEEVLSEMGVSLDEVFVSKNQNVAKSDIDAFYNFVDMTLSG